MTCFVVVQTMVLLLAVINASLSLTEVNFCRCLKWRPDASGQMTYWPNDGYCHRFASVNRFFCKKNVKVHKYYKYEWPVKFNFLNELRRSYRGSPEVWYTVVIIIVLRTNKWVVSKIIYSKSLSQEIVSPIGDDITENSDDDSKLLRIFQARYAY